ncbi:hypothetical protein Moror_12396 [Moniliophthora roreri MCA 2997]|uniref:Uncharacterized protein n=2 Tax=Moniliophthora roreri TaxID=221103 RepID=V2YVS0_MONRO|nr:hypothetical protein Moror_12396 [Moniliophthora roreri MCA 2997]KAI3616181.1 hypothetical protein WG66_013965 [Moniliophthora roreri]
MGRSAKVHKRVQKKNKTSISSFSTPAASNAPSQAQHLHVAKKKANLKEKAKATATASQSKRKEGGRVLGDVDYVSLMMGGRRKAKEEAAKLAAMEVEE